MEKNWYKGDGLIDGGGGTGPCGDSGSVLSWPPGGGSTI